MNQRRLTRASLIDLASPSPPEDPFRGEFYVNTLSSPPEIEVYDGSRWVSTSKNSDSDDTLALIIALS